MPPGRARRNGAIDRKIGVPDRKRPLSGLLPALTEI
jgi:hypothetical protein